MLYVLIKITALHFFLRTYVAECHLKDMGEVTTSNWTTYFQALESRIVGGKSTNLIHYPFMVQFFNFGGLCGGVIVTSKTVLTAGHCFSHNKNLAEMKIFSNPRFTFDINARIHEVWDYEIHVNYSYKFAFSNDIAIIIIHDKFVFGPQIQKATFTETDVWMKENEVFVATGWGEKKYGAGLPETDLQMIHLHYVSREKCEAVNQVKLAPEMFCLYGDGERDTCRGDSGGGVLWNGVVVGIISHGRKCAQSPEGKIVGGHPATIESFPFAILFLNDHALCSGVILNSFSLLTAAHCFDSNTDTDKMEVAIGSRYIRDLNADIFEVFSFVIHEDYSQVMPFSSDIALIFLQEPIKFDVRKQKAMLVNNNNWMECDDNGLKCYKDDIVAVGWGWTTYGGSISDLGLLQTSLRFTPRQECEKLHSLCLTKDMFCLYGDGARDTCKGDSGGGVLWNGTVIGIVSHGDGCAKKDKPSVYISVYYHRGWIERQIRSFVEKYCKIKSVEGE